MILGYFTDVSFPSPPYSPYSSFLSYLGLNSGASFCSASTLPLETCPSPFCFSYFVFSQGWPQTALILPMPPMYLGSQVHATISTLLRWGLDNFFPGLRLNCDPHILFLLNSLDYSVSHHTQISDVSC
jgi:hypothetical protein